MLSSLAIIYVTFGKIVCEAIDNGEVESVELALQTVKLSLECREMDVLQHGKDLICFF